MGVKKTKKLLGFGALHFQLLAKKLQNIGVMLPLPPIRDPNPSRSGRSGPVSPSVSLHDASWSGVRVAVRAQRVVPENFCTPITVGVADSFAASGPHTE